MTNKNVEFVFIDLTEFNEYILVYSTKRSEGEDKSGEQLLNRDSSR